MIEEFVNVCGDCDDCECLPFWEEREREERERGREIRHLGSFFLARVEKWNLGDKGAQIEDCSRAVAECPKDKLLLKFSLSSFSFFLFNRPQVFSLFPSLSLSLSLLNCIRFPFNSLYFNPTPILALNNNWTQIELTTDFSTTSAAH